MDVSAWLNASHDTFGLARLDVTVNECEVDVVETHRAEIAAADAPEHELEAVAGAFDRSDVFELRGRILHRLYELVFFASGPMRL